MFVTVSDVTGDRGNRNRGLELGNLNSSPPPPHPPPPLTSHKPSSKTSDMPSSSPNLPSSSPNLPSSSPHLPSSSSDLPSSSSTDLISSSPDLNSANSPPPPYDEVAPRTDSTAQLLDTNNVVKLQGEENAETRKCVEQLEEVKEEGEESGEGDGRETWGTKFDFLLSIIGFAVDLANIWRFPYLCYKNGGGAFLIPYIIMLLIGGIPLLYMELLLGQFHRKGAIAVWKLAPIFKGIGYCSCLISFMVAFYYNVVIGWSFYYLFRSFTPHLPWTACGNDWNTVNCTTNRTISNDTRFTPSAEYFNREVLNISDGIDEPGEVQWKIALCTLLAFVTLFFVLFKGVKTSGKVVYFTALMPYVVLSILLIRGFFLDGFKVGIEYYITPRMDRLAHAEVWIDAAVQIMYSVGPGFGVHIAYASFNKFHNNVYMDTLVTVAVNSFTSFFSGFVIFSYLGYMSVRYQVPVDEVATQGPGLVFVVYPEAIATLPGSSVWSCLFFLMLLTLGLDSAMGGMESVLTGLADEYPKLFTGRKYSRQLASACIIFSAFLVSLACCTRGGMYVLNLLDNSAAGVSLLFAVLLEAITVAWFYGLDQFVRDAELMMGFRPGIYWRILWKFLAPIFILAILLSAVTNAKPLKYEDYVYPSWATSLGWLVATTSMTLIPIYAIIKFMRSRHHLRLRVALLISPKHEHYDIKRTGYVKRFHWQHWLSLGDDISWSPSLPARL